VFYLYWLLTDMLQKLSHEASTVLTVLLTCLYVLSNASGDHTFLGFNLDVSNGTGCIWNFNFAHILRLVSLQHTVC
jgi:hypothetical protein